MVKEAIKGRQVADEMRESIRKSLTGKTLRQNDYFHALTTYLLEAVKKDETDDAERVFKLLYADDWPRYVKEFASKAKQGASRKRQLLPNIVYLALFLKGLGDLAHEEFRQREAITSKTRKVGMVRNLYYQASLDDALLVVGETGTGKEAFAEALHLISPRRGKKLIKINCAALPEALVESELYGHVKGAYTGATNNKEGLFELAKEGTLFLDELGKMSKQQQVKLLRVLEEKKIRRVGTTDEMSINVRFLAAAQPSDIEDETIHPDLLYRLGFPDHITLPPLRERIAIDPERITKSALRIVNKQLNLPVKVSIDPKATERLGHTKYEYPGNYRELISILKSAARSALQSGRRTITTNHLTLFEHLKRGRISVGPAGPKTGAAVTYSPGKEKLKDIFVVADRERVRIIKEKLHQIWDDGRDLKEVLLKEGMNESQYNGYLKKLTRALGGESIRRLKKGR